MSDFRIGSAFVEVGARDRTDADVQRIVAKVSGKKASIKVDVDSNGVRRAEASIGSSVNGIVSKLGLVNLAARAAGVGLAAGLGGAAVGALPGLAAAGASAAGVLIGSFHGIGDALQGYKDDQDAAGVAGAKSTKDAASNARAIRDAQSSITDARRSQARAAEDAARDIAAAERDQSRTARAGAEAIDSASRRVRDAIESERRAQENLTEARGEATRSLEDLREVVSDYALDEDQAAQAVAEARVRLSSANRDVFTSDLQRHAAALDLRSAEERLSDIQRERAEKTAELADAEKAGVNGSQQVIAAQERVASAHQNVTEAQDNLSRTQRDANEANQAAARHTAEVMQQAGQQQEDAARSVATAIQGLQDVQASQAQTADIAAESSSKYQDALNKLNPAQRELVAQLISMGPLLTGLRDTGSEAFLPGLTSMLRDSEGLFPIFNDALGRTGSIMGDTARQAGELFTDPEFKNNLDTLLQSTDPIVKAIGDLIVGLTEDTIGFGAQMAPVTEGVGHFIDSVGIGLGGFFDNLAPHADSFKKIFEQLGVMMEWALPMIGSLMGGGADAAAWFIEKVNQAKVKIVEWWGDLDRFAIWWDSLGGRARVAFDNLMRAVADKMTGAKDAALGRAGELVDGITGWFWSLPGRAGDAFNRTKDAIGQAFDGIMERTKAPIRWVIDVVYNNGIRGLWDKVRGVFGGSELPYFMPFARGGVAPGRDLGYDYVPALLRGGEGVLVPEATRAMGGAAGIDRINRMAEAQRFASGGVAGYHGSASASITKTTGSVQASGGGISQLFTAPLEYIKNLFSGVLGDAGRTPGSGMLRDAVVGLPNKIIDLIVQKATGLFSGGMAGAGPVGSGVQRWSNLVLQALGMVGEPASLLNVVLRRMNQESGGNPRAINLWDINAKRGIPSKGLMQTIDPTFRAYHFPGTSNDVYDPLANVLASMNYAKARYGSLSAAYNRKGGYDLGGIASGVGMLPKYTPQPERVLSPEQTVAFERLVDSLTGTGGAGARPVVVNVNQTSGSPAETGRFVSLALRSA